MFRVQLACVGSAVFGAVFCNIDLRMLMIFSILSRLWRLFSHPHFLDTVAPAFFE